MHGEYGEDGTVQKILESHNIPHVGSDSLSSRIAMRKNIAKDIFKHAGLNVLPSRVIKNEDDEETIIPLIHKEFGPPFVVKPIGRGSSVGISIVRTLPELRSAVEKARKFDSTVMMERYIKGREATCGVLENFRGEKHYALPVIEIIPPKGRFFDYDCKYDGSTKEICPGRFSKREITHIKDAAIRAHKALGCRHYSRTDMIVANDTVWVLETNTLPGFTAESLVPKAAKALGLSFPNLLDHLIGLALKK